MNTIYDVQVERHGFGYCTVIRTAASSPMLACETAERLAARELYGDDWAKVVHEFFAYQVRPIESAERPSDIPLPAGWTWDRVEAERDRWGIAPNMVPLVASHGAVAWGTINSVRMSKAA